MTSRCFVTSFDQKYYKYATVMLQTLADNYKKPLDVVCIVTQDLIDNNTLSLIKSKLNRAEHLNIIFRASKNNREVITAKPWEKISVYLSSMIIEKILISSICHDYDEAVYVDGDCIFTQNATKFIEHPFHANSKIIALPEQSMLAAIDLKSPERAYFNNGVFVTDLNYWRENKIEEKIVNWLINEETGSCPEQTAMNVFLHDVWFPLSPNFNYWDSFSTDGLKMSYPEPTIVHFVGPIKPWNWLDDDTIIKRGPHDKLWKYIYNQLWNIETVYKKESIE